MTVIDEPKQALMDLPIEQLVELTGDANLDLGILTHALKYRLQEARQKMTMQEIAQKTGFTRTTIYNWHNRAQ